MLRLDKDEIAFLRWLHTNGGHRTFSALVKPSFVERMIAAKYVATETDACRLDAVRYQLTENGREALGLHEKK
jgi:hypothetical protein